MSVSALTFFNMSFECESLTLKMSGPMSDHDGSSAGSKSPTEWTLAGTHQKMAFDMLRGRSTG